MVHSLTAAHTGSVVHLAVQALVRNPADTPSDIATRVLARRGKIPGAVAGTVRVRLLSNMAVYRQRCEPTAPWALLGAEVPLPGCFADLGWVDPTGRIVVEEIKTGAAELADHLDQVGLLARAGRARWGSAFVGVRFTPLGCPRRTKFVTLTSNDTLAVVDAPDGMGVR